MLFEDASFPAANVRIFAHVPPHLRAAVRAGRRAYEQYWIDLLTVADGASPQLIDPRQLTMFLFGATNWTLEWHKAKNESLDELADNLTGLFFMGSEPKRPPPRSSATARSAVDGGVAVAKRSGSVS